jgi:hypothetical protein
LESPWLRHPHRIRRILLIGFERDASPDRPPLNPDVTLGAHPPAVALIADADAIVQAGGARPRLCVLCGRPLRAGQHTLRVHGSTIHARCSNTGR